MFRFAKHLRRGEHLLVNAARVPLALILTTLILITPAIAHAQEAPPIQSPPPAKEPAVDQPLRWAGTTFGASYSTSVSTLGAGDYTAMSNDFSVLSAAFSTGYFLVAEPRHQLRISTSVSGSIILEDPFETTDEPDAFIADLPLRLTYSGQLHSIGTGKSIGGLAAMTDPTLRFETGAHRTWILASTGLIFPTSAVSRGTEKYLDLNAGITIRQQIRLRPDDASAFTHLLISVGESWTHTFADDQTIGAYSNHVNRLSHGLSMLLRLYEDLHFGTGFSVQQTWLPDLGDRTCIVIATNQCVATPSIPSPALLSTSFGWHVSYLLIPEFGLTVGYANGGSTIGPDGKRQNPFYGPNATVNASAILSFDQLYLRFARRPTEGK